MAKPITLRVPQSCDRDRVIGYYSLAAGCIDHAKAPGRLRRNMPDPIPIRIYS
ncbi:MAG: hypothetical protein MUD14_21840 [Hydrococcus sp. Prado102]|nr:hypothetical protein [Hydrococcus sp. Prado102]